MDDRDRAIAALRAQLETERGAKPGGVVVGTLKVVATLAFLAVALFVLFVIVVQSLPQPTAEERMADARKVAARIEAECDRQYAGFPESSRNDCKIRRSLEAGARF